MAAQLAPAEVEVMLERALAELPDAGWHVIDTRREVRGTRVDFVVVGPPGLFVIACGQPREKERARAKQMMSLLDTMQSVTEVAGVHRDEAHPVLCLLGDTPEDSWSRGVSVCSTVNLADTLMFKRHRLEPDEVESAARAVSQTMSRGKGKHKA